MTEAPSRPQRSSRPTRRPASAAVRRRRWGALVGGALLLVVAVVVVLLLRGGSDDARAIVARGLASDGDLPAARVSFKLGLTGSAAADGEPILLELSGPYAAGDAETARFRFDIGVNDGGDEPVATLTGVEGRSYLTVGKQSYVLDTAALDEWKDEGAEKDDGLSLDALGIDPEAWLADPEVVGEERRDGEQVTHVRSKVDVARMTDDLKKLVGRAEGAEQVGDEAKAAAAALGSIERDISSATMDVWVAEGKGAMRRIQIDVRLEDGRLALDLALKPIDEPVEIRAPKGARPFDELLSVFAAVTGARGATGTTTEPAAPRPGTTTPGAASGGAYAACVEAAGDDIGKLQDCADVRD